jgi:hypothetical protein
MIYFIQHLIRVHDRSDKYSDSGNGGWYTVCAFIHDDYISLYNHKEYTTNHTSDRSVHVI